MKEKILYQLRIDFEEHAAKELLNNDKIQSCKQLFSILKEENANLISLFICFGFSCIFTFIATWMFKTGYKIKS